MGSVDGDRPILIEDMICAGEGELDHDTARDLCDGFTVSREVVERVFLAMQRARPSSPLGHV